MIQTQPSKKGLLYPSTSAHPTNYITSHTTHFQPPFPMDGPPSSLPFHRLNHSKPPFWRSFRTHLTPRRHASVRAKTPPAVRTDRSRRASWSAPGLRLPPSAVDVGPVGPCPVGPWRENSRGGVPAKGHRKPSKKRHDMGLVSLGGYCWTV